MSKLISFAKKNDFTIQFVKEASLLGEITIKQLQAKRQEILDYQTKENALREAEIAEIDELLAQCNILGIIEEGGK